MKTLILNRHAKSDWDHPGLHDFERPLNNRGLKDAPFMANIFAERNIQVDLLFSSTAIRAKTTAEFFIKELNLSPSQVNFTKEIYNSGITFVRETLPLLNDKVNTVMFFGHNPDFSSLVKYYSAANIGALPSCGIAIINFEIDSWNSIDEFNGTLEVFDYPKNYEI